MTLFYKIYEAIKDFFIYLSFRTHGDYVNLNEYDDIEEVIFI